MTEFKDWLGIIGGVLTLLGVLVALTRYLTRVQEQAARDKIENKNRNLENRLTEVESQRDQLLNQIELAGKAGGLLLSQKAELDKCLQGLMAALDTSGGSIYVPLRGPRGDVHGLAFLAIEPFNVKTHRLRSKIIPLKSISGRCFVQSDAFVTINTAKNDEHFKAADEISSYTPSTTLNMPLVDDTEVVGVLQLLRKKGEPVFSEADLPRVSAMLEPITKQVSAIVKSPDYMKLINPTEDSKSVTGTVMYFDISGSSILFQEFSAAFALKLLNEYFEKMCEAAFKRGGTLDNYMGDGALLRFNISRPIAEHEWTAVQTAMEMKDAFSEIKEYWVALNPRLNTVQFRAAIATGSLLRANLGHSQFQTMTIIGPPISVASAMCDEADRSRPIILASDECFEAVNNRVVAKALSIAPNSKILNFCETAYEIEKCV